MGLPAIIARGLPGKRDDAYRAGITPRTRDLEAPLEAFQYARASRYACAAAAPAARLRVVVVGQGPARAGLQQLRALPQPHARFDHLRERFNRYHSECAVASSVLPTRRGGGLAARAAAGKVQLSRHRGLHRKTTYRKTTYRETT